jgi:hypothetical protein
MRRVLAVLVGAGLAAGGGAAAWAQTGGANREAAKACLAEARAADPDAGKTELREAVKACLEAQGITPRGARREPTPEQQAAREALRACLQGVRAAHHDAERAELRDEAKACFDEAGIAPRRVRPKLAQLRECRESVLAEHPDAARDELRRLVMECARAR